MNRNLVSERKSQQTVAITKGIYEALGRNRPILSVFMYTGCQESTDMRLRLHKGQGYFFSNWVTLKTTFLFQMRTPSVDTDNLRTGKFYVQICIQFI